jgi:sporulation integral membrane protein YtvI
MAIVVDPLVGLFQRLRLRRTPAVVAALVTVLGGVLVVIVELLTMLVRELLLLSRQLPQVFQGVEAWADGTLHRVGGPNGLRIPAPQSLLNSQLATAYHVTGTVLQAVLGVALALPNAFLVAALALIAVFFLLRDKQILGNVLEWLVPPGMRRGLPSAREEVLSGTLGFLRAQMLLVSTTAVCVSLGLVLYGSRYALLLGLLAGVLDLIPYLGAAALLGPWAAVLFFTGHPVQALTLLAILGGAALVRQVMEPHLVGSGTGLHPLTALLAPYVGVRLFGPLGFVIGPITAVALKAGARAAGVPPFGH